MPLILIAPGIVFLREFIIVFKINTFIAFVFVSFLLGISESFPFVKAVSSVQQGIGETLGSQVMKPGLEAMPGKLVADKGPARVLILNLFL